MISPSRDPYAEVLRELDRRVQQLKDARRRLHADREADVHHLEGLLQQVASRLSRGHVGVDEARPFLPTLLPPIGPRLLEWHRSLPETGAAWDVTDSQGRVVARLLPPAPGEERWRVALLAGATLASA